MLLRIYTRAAMPPHRGPEICWRCSLRVLKRDYSTRQAAVQLGSQSFRGADPLSGQKIAGQQRIGDFGSRLSGNISITALNHGKKARNGTTRDHRYLPAYSFDELQGPPIIPQFQTQYQEAPRSTADSLQSATRKHSRGSSQNEAVPDRHTEVKKEIVSSEAHDLAGSRLSKQRSLVGSVFHKTHQTHPRYSTNGQSRAFSVSRTHGAAIQSRKEKQWADDLSSVNQAGVQKNLPIRDHLKRFEKALQDTSEERKAALGVAFSVLSGVSGLDGKVAGEDGDATEDVGDELIESDGFQGYKLHEYVQPGDLVELVSGSIATLAVITACFTNNMSKDTPHQFQAITNSGIWIQRPWRLVKEPKFIVKRFAHPREFQAVKEFLPDDHLPAETLEQLMASQVMLPTETTGLIAAKLRDFEQGVNQAYRSNSSRLDNLFALVSNQENMVYLTLEQIARRVLNTPKHIEIPPQQLYAVHRACLTFHVGITSVNFHWATQLWGIYSKRELNMMAQVQGWVREHSEQEVRAIGLEPTVMKRPTVIQTFADEIRPIILESRKNRELSSFKFVGPSKLPPNKLMREGAAFEVIEGQSVSPSTSTILKFLEIWFSHSLSGPTLAHFTSTGSIILKSIGLYGDGTDGNLLADPSFAAAVLRECGIISPWASRYRRGTSAQDPPSGSAANLTQLLSEVKSECEERHLDKDAMQDLRHDWGDLPVFCVDGEFTTVVDDGISLEKSADANAYWIHIHIANPSAFIHPRSALAKYLRRKGASQYLPDSVEQMFPDEDIVKQFSLQRGRPVLTVSIKLNFDGLILDRKVQNGFINNVLHVTPEVVKNIVDPVATSPTERALYVVGKLPTDPSSDGSKAQLSTEHQETLQTMHHLVEAWLGRSNTAWKREWRLPLFSTSDIKVFGSQDEDKDFSRFRHFVGDPTIMLKATPWEPYSSPRVVSTKTKQDLVTTCMILANHSIANWCAERGVPIIFRQNKLATDVDLNEFANRTTQKKASAAEDLQDWVRWQGFNLVSDSTLSDKMGAHQFLALDGYAQCSSPLRRFHDMLNHWQIEAALRKEAKVRRPVTELDDVRFPFPRHLVNEIIRESFMQTSQQKMRLLHTREDWLTQLLMRGSVYKQCQNLPELFTIYWTSVRGTARKGYISELNWHFAEPYTTSGPQVGEVWKHKAMFNPDKYGTATLPLLMPAIERVH